MNKVKISHIIIYMLLILLIVICVTPFYIMIINSTHNNSELYTGVSILPGTSLMTNVTNMLAKVNMLRGFMNSAFIALSSTAFSIYFGTMTAYGLYEYRFRFRKVVYAILMISLMVPGQIGIIGLFRLCNSTGLLDTYWPLILPGIANASTIFFIMQFMESSMDEDLLDSARIDGASEVMILHSLILPLCKPALSTMAITNFVGYWNNFFNPMILLFSEKKFTVPLLINNLNNGMLQDLGAKYAAIAMSILPIIIVYCFVSGSLTEGMMAGAVKG